MTPLRLFLSALISAPTAIVWRITTDVARWADWSPTITAVSGWGGGPLFQDARFDLKQAFKRTRSWVVLKCAKPHSLLLCTPEGDTTALHEVAKTKNGFRSRLALELTEYTTRRARPIFSIALRRENAALQNRCERFAESDIDVGHCLARIAQEMTWTLHAEHAASSNENTGQGKESSRDNL